MRVLTRRAGILLCGLLLAMLCSTASAKEVALVLSRADGVFASFSESFRNSLDQANVRVVDGGVVGSLRPDILENADWIVAAGESAAEAVLGLSEQGPSILLALSARAQYQALRKRYPKRHISAVVLDQPAERHLALISALLPDVQRVGALLGPDTLFLEQEYSLASANFTLEWVARSVMANSELARAMERVLRDSDVFIAVPDALLTTSAAARAILLISYRYRRPVIGFSRAYVDAGALAAVFSTPGQNARDCADWISGTLNDDGVEPGYVWPTRFEVATNPQVARSLSIDLAGVTGLEARLAPPVEEAVP